MASLRCSIPCCLKRVWWHLMTLTWSRFARVHLGWCTIFCKQTWHVWQSQACYFAPYFTSEQYFTIASAVHQCLKFQPKRTLKCPAMMAEGNLQEQPCPIFLSSGLLVENWFLPVVGIWSWGRMVHWNTERMVELHMRFMCLLLETWTFTGSQCFTISTQKQMTDICKSGPSSDFVSKSCYGTARA